MSVAPFSPTLLPRRNTYGPGLSAKPTNMRFCGVDSQEGGDFLVERLRTR